MRPAEPVLHMQGRKPLTTYAMPTVDRSILLHKHSLWDIWMRTRHNRYACFCFKLFLDKLLTGAMICKTGAKVNDRGLFSKRGIPEFKLHQAGDKGCTRAATAAKNAYELGISTIILKRTLASIKPYHATRASNAHIIHRILTAND